MDDAFLAQVSSAAGRSLSLEYKILKLANSTPEGNVNDICADLSDFGHSFWLFHDQFLRCKVRLSENISTALVLVMRDVVALLTDLKASLPSLKLGGDSRRPRPPSYEVLGAWFQDKARWIEREQLEFALRIMDVVNNVIRVVERGQAPTANQLAVINFSRSQYMKQMLKIRELKIQTAITWIDLLPSKFGNSSEPFEVLAKQWTRPAQRSVSAQTLDGHPQDSDPIPAKDAEELRGRIRQLEGQLDMHRLKNESAQDTIAHLEETCKELAQRQDEGSTRAVALETQRTILGDQAERRECESHQATIRRLEAECDKQTQLSKQKHEQYEQILTRLAICQTQMTIITQSYESQSETVRRLQQTCDNLSRERDRFRDLRDVRDDGLEDTQRDSYSVMGSFVPQEDASDIVLRPRRNSASETKE